MPLIIRYLGPSDYKSTWQAMQAFTENRDKETPDELWVTEHPPVLTLGQSGKPEHILKDLGLEVIRTDRGGQVTYHGPGQAVVYLLLDLRRLNLKVREMVALAEEAIIALLADQGLKANRREGAPGVYLGALGQGAKIAALGFRVKNGCTYHGISLNVDMDLTPFSAINPCGYVGLAVTQMKDCQIPLSTDAAGKMLCQYLQTCLKL